MITCVGLGWELSFKFIMGQRCKFPFTLVRSDASDQLVVDEPLLLRKFGLFFQVLLISQIPSEELLNKYDH